LFSLSWNFTGWNKSHLHSVTVGRKDGGKALEFGKQLEDEGYTIVPAVFSSAEIDAISDALGSCGLARSRAGIRHAMSHPSVANLGGDSRLVALASTALDEPSVAYRATLFDKSPEANWLVVWHQDTALPRREKREAPGWGPWSVKEGIVYAHAPTEALRQVVALRIHLDDSTSENGPLRILPGTHEQGVLTDDEIHAFSQKISPVECVSARGGVVAMRPLAIHASSKSACDRPRRVLHIEYTTSSAFEDLQLAIA
jgi:ectoine hydroxylase-related dioxygenase (phytanoyl-CoA dioxygenase family)